MTCAKCQGENGVRWPFLTAENPDRQREWLKSLGYDARKDTLCIGCVCTLALEHPWATSTN